MAHSLNVPLIEIGGFKLLYYGQMDCAPGWSGEYDLHAVTGLLFHFVQKGKGTVINYTNNEEYQIHGGEAFVFHPENAYYYAADQDDPWSYVWFSIAGEQMERLMAFLQEKHIGAVHLQEPNVVLGRIRQLFSYQQWSPLCDELFYSGIVSMLLYDFFTGMPLDTHLPEGTTDSGRTDTNRYIFLATGYIAEHYAQSLTVEEIAKFVGIERSYFSRLFKKHTGMTPGEYLMRYRINKATFLLANSDKRVADISLEVGFNYEHYFTKVFKQCIGITPSEYRKRIQSGGGQMVDIRTAFECYPQNKLSVEKRIEQGGKEK